jgi:hypothetical protein
MDLTASSGRETSVRGALRLEKSYSGYRTSSYLQGLRIVPMQSAAEQPMLSSDPCGLTTNQYEVVQQGYYYISFPFRAPRGFRLWH